MLARRLVLALASLSACAAPGAVSAPSLRAADAEYRLGAVSPAWERARVGRVQLALHHPEGGVLSANALCQGVDDVPLDVLTNHLLFGIEHRRERPRITTTLAGRAALRTELLGTLDGVEVELALVVMKRDGCIFDLQLVAGPRAFAARRPDFDAFVRGFARAGER